MEVIGALGGDLALTQPGLGALADVSAWLSMLAAALIYTPIIWGEEFGWRGYLQIRLLAQRPLQAAVVTGLIWGIWHFGGPGGPHPKRARDPQHASASLVHDLDLNRPGMAAPAHRQHLAREHRSFGEQLHLEFLASGRDPLVLGRAR